MPSPPAGDTKPRNTPNGDPDMNPKNNPNPKTNSTTNPVTNPITDTEPTPASASASAPPTITIRISPQTQERLDSVKHSPEESYDTVISRLCDRLIDDEPLSEETLKTIEKSLAELREGIFHTHEEIMQDLITRKTEHK